MKIAYTYEKNVVRKRPLFSWILLCFSTLNLFAILYVIITITEFTCLFFTQFCADWTEIYATFHSVAVSLTKSH